MFLDYHINSVAILYRNNALDLVHLGCTNVPIHLFTQLLLQFILFVTQSKILSGKPTIQILIMTMK